jgi:UbiD family decarboxylase
MTVRSLAATPRSIPSYDVPPLTVHELDGGAVGPDRPVRVASGPVQETTWTGTELLNGHGLDIIPVPISTLGFDNAPYLTSANWITKEIESSVYNIGNYRSQIKSLDRIGGLFTSQHMGQHLAQM